MLFFVLVLKNYYDDIPEGFLSAFEKGEAAFFAGILSRVPQYWQNKEWPLKLLLAE